MRLNPVAEAVRIYIAQVQGVPGFTAYLAQLDLFRANGVDLYPRTT